MINGLMTLSGAWDKLRTDPVLRMLVVSLKRRARRPLPTIARHVMGSGPRAPKATRISTTTTGCGAAA
jgi:hypothetical protein